MVQEKAQEKKEARDLILITRPREEALAFSSLLSKSGHQTLIEPMLEIMPIKYDLPDIKNFQGVIFTSAHGVEFFNGATDLPAWCVGGHTAAQARLKGFRSVRDSRGSVADLCDRIIVGVDDRACPFLYVRGVHAAFPMTEKLHATGLLVKEIIVYNALLAESFTPACVAALKNGAVKAVTFFSKRTAVNFARLTEQHDLLPQLKTIKCLSISEAVLNSVRSCGWAETYAAAAPSAEGMLKLIADVYPGASDKQG